MFSSEFFSHMATVRYLFSSSKYYLITVINANKIITKIIIIKNGIKKSQTLTLTKNKQNHNITPIKFRLK